MRCSSAHKEKAQCHQLVGVLNGSEMDEMVNGIKLLQLLNQGKVGLVAQEYSKLKQEKEARKAAIDGEALINHEYNLILG